MKTCDEMIESLFVRRERYVAEKKRHKKMIAGVAASIACFALVTVCSAVVFSNRFGNLRVPNTGTQNEMNTVTDSTTVQNENTSISDQTTEHTTQPSTSTTVSDQVSNPTHSSTSSTESTDFSSQGDDPDEIAALVAANQLAPAYGTAMFLDKSNKRCFSPLVYNGGDFEFYLEIYTNSYMNYEFGVGFILDGVYQDIKIEYGGTVTDYAFMHKVDIPAGETATIKVYLRPNIGKKGETLNFSLAMIESPSFILSQPDMGYASPLTDRFNDICFSGMNKFQMNADSTGKVSVCKNFSGLSYGSYNTLIKQFFSEGSDQDSVCRILLYDKLNKVLSKDRHGEILYTTQIDAKKSTSYDLTVTLGNRSNTTQRVSVYMNNELLPVFDGAYYADVTLEEGKQTDLHISIDTSQLGEYNKLYVVACEQDSTGKPLSELPYQLSEIYVFRVS